MHSGCEWYLRRDEFIIKLIVLLVSFGWTKMCQNNIMVETSTITSVSHFPLRSSSLSLDTKISLISWILEGLLSKNVFWEYWQNHFWPVMTWWMTLYFDCTLGDFMRLFVCHETKVIWHSPFWLMIRLRLFFLCEPFTYVYCSIVCECGFVDLHACTC